MLRNAFRLVNLLVDLGLGIFTLMSLDNAVRFSIRAHELKQKALSAGVNRRTMEQDAEHESKESRDSSGFFLIGFGLILAHRLVLRLWRRLRA